MRSFLEGACPQRNAMPVPGGVVNEPVSGHDSPACLSRKADA